MKFVILALFFAAFPAQSAEVLKLNADGKELVFRLLETPCSDATVVSFLRENFYDVARFSRGTIYWVDGKLYEWCYVRFKDHAVGIDSTGEEVLQPLKEFEEESI